MFGTATLTCAGRILIRLYTRRKLFLDDVFLILGFFSLIGGTILLKQVPVFYLVLATLQGDFWATVLSFKKINDVIKQWDYIYAYFVFLWTSIYAVKGCYFAFFAQFRRTMTRTFNWYYWIAVGFSVVCWIWSCVALTIACPYFGDGARKYSCTAFQKHNTNNSIVKCFPDLPISKRIVRLLFWLYPILDGISDLMSTFSVTFHHVPVLWTRVLMWYYSHLHPNPHPKAISTTSNHQDRPLRIPMPLHLHDRLQYNSSSRLLP